MRCGFVTCVQLGADVLDEILEVGGHVDAMVTLHDDLAPNKSGRVRLDSMAKRHGATLHKTHHINDPETVEWLTDQDLDWLFIIGWSQIAGPEVLECTKNGVLGMHPTLLPMGRGRASIPWAIIKGLETTGVTLFQLDEGVDTGPIAEQIQIALHSEETASTLYSRAMHAHRELIRSAWPKLQSGDLRLIPQDETKASTWPARRPTDGLIDPGMSMLEVSRLVRALAPPYPGARWIDSTERCWRVYCGTTSSELPGLRISLRDGIYTAQVFERIQ